MHKAFTLMTGAFAGALLLTAGCASSSGGGGGGGGGGNNDAGIAQDAGNNTQDAGSDAGSVDAGFDGGQVSQEFTTFARGLIETQTTASSLPTTTEDKTFTDSQNPQAFDAGFFP